MNQKILFLSIIFAWFCLIVSCEEKNKIKDDNSCIVCTDKEIIKILKDEPAIIKEGCYNYLGVVSSFSIVLVNEPESQVYISQEIFPCGDMPKEFQVDKLAVLISGNILNYGAFNDCNPPCPECKLTPTNFFELKAIKINK